MAYCVIVPAYEESGRIGKTIAGIREQGPDVVVVDDGSTDGTADAARAAGAVTIEHETNMGKGVALNTGLAYASRQGYEFVITMDADGQHDPCDIPAFVDAFERTGAAVIVGSRMDRCGGMPFVRRQTNRFMSWLLSLKMGQRVPDTQSGFRLYRQDMLPFVGADSAGYAAESEVLLRLADRGVRIGSVPIRVIYGDETSKIRPIGDTIRFFAMLRRYNRSRKPEGENR